MVTSAMHFVSPQGEGDISVFPMSIPLLAGPGSLTVSILLFSNVNEPQTQFSVLLAVLLICLLTFCCFCASAGIKKLIGRTGDEILRRFLGVLLAALAIQFILDGWKGVVGQ